MPHVNIPDNLFQQIEKILPPAVSTDDYVVEAVREKLVSEDHKRRFFELSERNRTAMKEKGLTEESFLTDFDQFRKTCKES
jgi:hypothetical protein